MKNPDGIIPEKYINHFYDFIKEYNTIFNMDKIVKYNIDNISESIFNRNIDSDIDQV